MRGLLLATCSLAGMAVSVAACRPVADLGAGRREVTGTEARARLVIAVSLVAAELEPRIVGVELRRGVPSKRALGRVGPALELHDAGGRVLSALDVGLALRLSW